MKEILKAYLPDSVLSKYRGVRLAFLRKKNAKRTAADVFSEVYRNQLWGRERALLFGAWFRPRELFRLLRLRETDDPGSGPG